MINLAILIKLSIFPFSNIIANIYKDSSFLSFLAMSFLINFHYIYILYIYNQLNNFPIMETTLFSYIVSVICLLTILSSAYYFNKQYELKGFTAYSSIVNTPLIIISFLNSNYVWINERLLWKCWKGNDSFKREKTKWKLGKIILWSKCSNCKPYWTIRKWKRAIRKRKRRHGESV